jgi:GAF domain-containing protein
MPLPSDDESVTYRPDLAKALEALAQIVQVDAPRRATLAEIARVCAELVPGADTASITVIGEDGTPHTEAFTTTSALVWDERQYDANEGPCLDAARGRGVVLVSDMATDQRWPVYGPAAAKAGVGSSLSIGLTERKTVTGAVNLYSPLPEAFDDASVEVATALAGYATAALASAAQYEALATLASQLNEALKSRAVIDQAKGVLIAQRGCTPDEAFEILRVASQNYNRKLRDIAVAIVDGAAAGADHSDGVDGLGR